jgi:hypothetical protein
MRSFVLRPAEPDLARDVLQVAGVRTHHNSQNLPMLAIDRKWGYVLARGTWSLQKTLEHPAAGASGQA